MASELNQRIGSEPYPRIMTEAEKKKVRSIVGGVRFWRTDFFRNYGYLLLCMLLPAALMYLIYLARGIYPFGDGCVLVLDLNGQYVWFFEALRNFFHGDASLLYSFERALGGEFLGIYAYYIASPLSFLVCFFPQNRMLEGLLTLFLLKTAICGGTFGFYLHKTLKNRKPAFIIAFSVFYALSSYAVVQQHNTMWIDAMMWLPLITLGMESLIKTGKFKLYTVFLALTLMSNFYIGYMVCFYCFFYFFLYYVAHAGSEGNPLGERRHFIKSLLRVFFYSVLAIGIAAVVLIGAYYSLNFGKTTFSKTKWEWFLNFDILDLLYKFLPGSYDTVRVEGYPFVYCGVLTILLVPAYFLSKKFSMRQKVCSALFIFVFIASFSLSVIDLFWHGFQAPNWLNYRYSFMLCFYLCVIACRALSDFEALPLRSVAGTAAAIALLCVFLQKYTDGGEFFQPDDYTCIWFTLIALFLYLAVLGGLRAVNGKQVLCVVLVTVVSAECFLNGLWNMNALDDDVVYSHYSYYNDFLNQTRPIVEDVQESDDSFYRMEKTFFRKVNDNMALGMRGLSGSTSTLNVETIQFLSKMGYVSVSHWSQYLGGTPVNDSLLGLKYIVSDNDIYSNYYETFKTDPENGYTAYRNPYALSIAYGVDEDVLDFPLGYQPAEKNPDEKASLIGSSVDKLKAALNRFFDIEETRRSDTYIDEYKSPMERLNAIITAMLGEEETVQVFVPIHTSEPSASGLGMPYYAEKHTCYEKSNEKASASVSYQLTMPVDGELYFCQPTKYPREVKLTLIDKKNSKRTSCGTFGGDGTTRITSLGMQTAGSDLTLEMTLKDDALYFYSGMDAFYYIDWDVFEDVMGRLGEDQYQIDSYDEQSFSGTFTASRPHELVLTTIAYDEGWKIQVDGNTVEPVKALGSLVAFYVDGDAGQTHTVTLRYRPKVVVIGLFVSLASLAILLLLILLQPILRKIPVLRAVVGATPGKKQNDKAPAEDGSDAPDALPPPNEAP